VPLLKSATSPLAIAAIADNDTSAALEPATGAVSLEANLYEQFVAELFMDNKVAALISVSFQFYGSDAASGDISATWTKIGVEGSDDPIVDASAATSGLKLQSATLHAREIGFKYVSVIATVTFSDQGAATTAVLTLRGESKRTDG
jgi:hypothetical protein